MTRSTGVGRAGALTCHLSRLKNDRAFYKPVTAGWGYPRAPYN